MKNLYLTILFLPFFIANSIGQTLSGTINDNEGKPVPYSTVFVKEIRLGTVSNEQGQYSLNLQSGDYSILFQCLGYETTEKKIKIKDGSNKLNVALNTKSYELKGVSVKPGSEDPAYAIIRKAIGMAPYYLNQIKEFEAEVYLKGTLKIVKLTWIVKRAMRNEADAPKEGMLYLQESVNNIHFTAPDKYDQTVKMIRSNFPSGEGNNGAMQFVNASLYDSKIGETILPLSPYALNHYKYRYEGYSKEGGRIINKIKVTPRRKSKQLVEGYLYIADKYWSIHSANLTIESIVGTISIQQTFGEVEKDIWLPINYNFDIIGKFLGNEGNVKYVSSVKYKTVKINSDIKVPKNLVSLSIQNNLNEASQQQIAKPRTKNPKEAVKEQKRKEKIEKLLEKDDLSNKDMYQLATLMAKDAKAADTTKKNLELKDNFNVKVDSLARKADTTQWNTIRPIALSTDEVQGMEALRLSVAKKDSADSKKDTLPKKKSLFSKVIFGHYWHDKERTKYSSFSGLINTSQLKFNTVDGFVTGMSFSYSKTLKSRSFSLNPQIAYAFNREVMMGRLSGGFSHTPSRRGYVGLSTGSESTDFNRESGINTFGNSVASLAFRANYMKLYEHHFGEIYNRIDLANGFDFLVRFGYYDRRMLENSTDFSFYPKDEKSYTPNLPINDTILGRYSPNHQAFIAKLSFSYTPEYFYRMYKNRKYMVSSKYPTFTLDTRLGVPDIAGSDVKFVQLEFGVKQSISVGSSNNFSYKVAYGDFLMKDKLYFPDFKHFNTQEIPVNIGDFANSFQLLEYYKHSTEYGYAQGFVSYTSPYLALKHLPWISNRMWEENLYASYLYTKGSKPYYEFGYSISQISIFGGIGIFVGFEGEKFQSFGVKASLKFSGEVSI
ncbi:MAG: carboxypeptidase-like regulatory domain-containing protein [Bacteroidales bacterium]|nr:MAG: carboxypeptidase-like regulatory domain-containing protein [Bacteroidales bacterium]